MSASRTNGWLRTSRPVLKWLVWISAAALCGAAAAPAQQNDQLEQELQQLRQQYDQTTRDLQQRISALEQQLENQRAGLEHQIEEQVANQQAQNAPNQQKQSGTTISAVELAAQQAVAQAVRGSSDQVGAKFQGQLPSAPTYDLLREADVKIEKLQEQVGSFEFHGYFRSGYGLNSRGGQQVAFIAPGADAKYRLGNEAETYGEFILVNNWLNPESGSDRSEE